METYCTVQDKVLHVPRSGGDTVNYARRGKLRVLKWLLAWICAPPWRIVSMWLTSLWSTGRPDLAFVTCWAWLDRRWPTKTVLTMATIAENVCFRAHHSNTWKNTVTDCYSWRVQWHIKNTTVSLSPLSCSYKWALIRLIFLRITRNKCAINSIQHPRCSNNGHDTQAYIQFGFWALKLKKRRLYS